MDENNDVPFHNFRSRVGFVGRKGRRSGKRVGLLAFPWPDGRLAGGRAHNPCDADHVPHDSRHIHFLFTPAQPERLQWDGMWIEKLAFLRYTSKRA